MYGFCRLGTIPLPSAARRLDVERARDEAEHEGEEDGDEPEDGHRPRDQLARAAVEPDREPRVAGEHEQPEQERALLAAPERGERVAERQLVARVLPDVDEGHVAASERDEQDDRRDERHREGGEQRVLRREREPPAPLPRGVRAGDERVRRRGRRRGGARRARAGPSGLARTSPARSDPGTSSISEPGLRDEDAVAQRPVDDDVASRLEQVGNAAVVHDRRRVRASPSPMSLTRKRRPPVVCGVALRRADDLADERRRHRCARRACSA